MSLRSTPFFFLAALAGFVVFCTALSEESPGPWYGPSLLKSEQELTAELMSLEAELMSLQDELSLETELSLEADQSLESDHTLESNQTLVQEFLDTLEKEYLSDIEDVGVEPLGLIRYFKQLRKCVRKIKVRNLLRAQRKILLSCIRPAFRGRPLTLRHIVLRYARCVVVKTLAGPIREAVQQVAHCMKGRKG